MNALSPVVASKFCELCEQAHTVWRTHRVLFDENPKKSELESSPAGKALMQLSISSHEYLLQQICKLHDRAIMNNNLTIGIDYIMRFGGWDAETGSRLRSLKDELDRFADQLREVRDKVLSHNDLEAHLSGGTLGAFAGGQDRLYFDKLQEFVNIVQESTFGSPAPFSDEPDQDAKALLAALK